jgi:DNA repair protein RecN (Recombination protein N)
LDHIEFLFQANKGGELREISKVASGGEFSRLMLAIKSITSKLKSLPTIIFDEIDTGVSGDVANKMGEIMRGMGNSMQVFSITHLPQVAVKGNCQYKVFKTVSKNITSTQVKKLNEHERIEEIAKMLSGDKLSDAALANAKELLGAK